MDASSFQFSLSVPRDAQFVPAVRSLAAQAARYASCGTAAIEAFAGSVEQAVRARLDQPSDDPNISIVVRRESGPVEVLIDGHAIAVEP